ncbi:hypothetical protein RR46_03789 [Papilio xuthus]|uniref:FLYWCH-type domain-containing protein n=1 Tax=Papilio xuthus TaxID=66420 RepID=A0A194Q343_PAPXU|nr:hypothetical protein RR46_03789 [Papilio xuthus]
MPELRVNDFTGIHSENSSELVAEIMRSHLMRETTNIFINGHKFFRHSRSFVGNRIRWTCAKKHSSSSALNDIYFGAFLYYPDFGEEGRMVITKTGCKSLMLGKYYYNGRQNAKNKHWRWYCAKYHRGCKAIVITNIDLLAKKYIGKHCHSPPDQDISGVKPEEPTPAVIPEGEALSKAPNIQRRSTLKTRRSAEQA